jgi:hypothetical protein
MAVDVTEVAVKVPELQMLFDPAVVPTQSEYVGDPVPAVHVNFTVGPPSVLLSAGDVITPCDAVV